MDLREVRQLVDIFYEADEDETGGLNKMELETALVRVWNVHVAPAADVEKAWEAMIGKRPMALERIIDEVKLDAFFHWYVETVGNQVLSKQVRRRPSLVTQVTSPLSKMSISSLSTGLSSSSLVEPLSPTSLTSTSEPMSPLSPLSPPPAALSEEAVTAMRKRFNRFAEGSCAQGVFFYDSLRGDYDAQLHKWVDELVVNCDSFADPGKSGKQAQKNSWNGSPSKWAEFGSVQFGVPVALSLILSFFSEMGKRQSVQREKARAST